MSDKELEIVRVFDAPVEKVFNAWTDASILKRWMGPGEVQCKEVNTDPKPGGRYRIHMEDPKCEQHVVAGSYTDIVANRHLSFSWQWEGTDVTTLVSLDFKTMDDGKTELTLRHTGFADAAARDHHNEGWVGCLDNLEPALR